jgi:hypothetical protein
MFHEEATIRDYNATTDTATVELVGAGIIDTWFDGVVIDASLNRSHLAHGTRITIATPDPHGIGQATVIGISTSPKQYTKNDTGHVRRYQFGRTYIATDNTGAGSVTVTFPIAFLNATNLQVHAACDDGVTLTVGTPTATQVTFTISGAAHNSYVYISWHAEGNQT